MRVYYFLNDISDENYDYFINKLDLLKSGFSCDDLIDRYFHKLGENNGEKVINMGFFPEVLKFIDYYRKKYKTSYTDALKKIIWVHNDYNFYIYGEDIHISKVGTSSYRKINKDNEVAFVTSRDTWLSPYFLALYKLSEIHKNIKVYRINKREGWIHNDDKVKNIYKLFEKKSNLVGKVLVPYTLSNDNQSLNVLLKSIRNKLGQFVVLKRNISQAGMGIKMIDIDFYCEKENLEVLKKSYLSVNNSSIFSVYFVPYYDIKKEFRVYYLYDKEKKKVKIYTIKNRVNICKAGIFRDLESNYFLDKDVTVKWNCMSHDDWRDDKVLKRTITKIAKSLGYDKGVIELIKTSEESLVYSEYNSLGGPLMFKEDQKKMQEYYYDMWKAGMKNI